jgi:crossover junction endodeoxyribonuclease RuvC
MQNLPILEFTPMQIKLSVVGYGKADKEAGYFHGATLIKYKEAKRPDDVSDALAMAICGCIRCFSPTMATVTENKTLK